MKKSQKGFTIIEVALVLAIGALIFLVVFLAVPALQRNQRNDARHRDVSNVVTAVTTWVSNNPNGNLADQAGSTEQLDAATGKGKKDETLGKFIDSLSANTESVVVKSAADVGVNGDTPVDIPANLFTADSGQPTKITVVVGAECSGTTQLVEGAARSSVVVGSTETTGDPVAYCSGAN